MDTVHHFPRARISVPADWIDESVITFVAPAKNGLAANVVITSTAIEGEAWEPAIEREMKELRKQTKNYRLIASEAITHQGAGGRRVEHTFLSPDRIPIRQIQLHVFSAGWLHTASISHADREFVESREELLRVLEGIRFE